MQKAIEIVSLFFLSDMNGIYLATPTVLTQRDIKQ